MWSRGQHLKNSHSCERSINGKPSRSLMQYQNEVVVPVEELPINVNLLFNYVFSAEQWWDTCVGGRSPWLSGGHSHHSCLPNSGTAIPLEPVSCDFSSNLFAEWKVSFQTEHGALSSVLPVFCCSVQSMEVWGCSGRSASPAAGSVWLQQPALLSCALLRAGTPLAPGWDCQSHTQHWGTPQAGPVTGASCSTAKKTPQPFHLAAFQCLS